jgi:competence protein ComEC
MVVRLRRPRGALSPGGFDYQAWLYQQGIGATDRASTDRCV